ncbi:MAG: hypothetical protein EXR65_01130 [Dehalococcoidia bacterium]|nr:hypothetical protein [Dehalococcoidia bacterium]
MSTSPLRSPSATPAARAVPGERSVPVPASIPFGPEQLDAQWLTEALREGGALRDAAVREATIERIGAQQAFAGQTVRVRLAYDREEPAAPRTLVAKFPAADATLRRALAGLRWYESELRFYDQLAARSAIRTPQRLFSAMDRARGEYVLLLEEVTAGPVGDQLAGASAEQARIVVQQLARFHAGWWADPRLNALGWLAVGAVRRAQGAEGWQQYYGRAWPAVRPVARALLAAGEFERLDAIAGRLVCCYASIVRASAEPPRTLLHGDCRLDNVFFPADRSPPVFIDFQLLSRARGPYDLAYFLGTNLEPTLRRQLEDELLRTYHAAIATAAAGGYDLDACRRDYRLGLLLAFGFWVQSAGAGTFPAAARPLRDVALRRLALALIDLDAEALLAEFERAG